MIYKTDFCCSNCFRDIELKGYINTNSSKIGDCYYCSTSRTELINISELSDMFQNLLDAYSIDESIEVEKSEFYLHNRLLSDWPFLFRITDSDKIKELLVNMYKGIDISNILNVPIKISIIPDDEQEILWDDFVKEIKSKNRFFLSNTINLPLLRSLFEKNRKKYRKGKIFYRSRLSDAEGINIENMGKPPYEKATAGRANPKGISYLYISDQVDTTLYETRSTIHDYVTVGDFKLKDDIQVLNLRDVNQISPFLLEDAIGIYLAHKQYLSRLEYELSKPIRRQDSDLDYLPTQYLCEFVKSIGFDGIEYKSSLYPDGFNIAIFNDIFFECIKITVYEIKNITYSYEQIV